MPGLPGRRLTWRSKAEAMSGADLLGYVAAVLTTVAFVPQAWKTFRTHDVSGISTGMYTVFTAGVASWLGYGILNGDWPIILANGLTLVLACAVLGMKLRFRGSS